MAQKIFNRFSLKKFLQLTALTLVLAFIVVFAARSLGTTSDAAPSFVNAEAQKLQQLVFASGTVVAKDNEIIVSPVSGKVIEVNAKLGDYVEKDKVLFVVEYQNQVGRKLKQEIKTSIPGTVVSISASVNQQVVASQLKMAEISDTRNLIVSATISEFDITKVRVGQNAKLEFTSLPAKTYSGVVDFIYPSAIVSQVDTGVNYTVQLKVESDSTLADQLKLGMSADVEVTVAEKQAKVSLEEEYLFSRDGETYVKLLENDELVDRKVEVGFKGETAVEILSGLTAAEKVVLPTTEIRLQRNSFRLFGN